MGKLLYHRMLRVVQVKKGVCAAAWGGAVTMNRWKCHTDAREGGEKYSVGITKCLLVMPCYS